MTGARVAPGFHENRHDIEIEADGPLDLRLLDRNRQRELLAAVLDLQIRFAVCEGKDISFVEFRERFVAERKSGVAGDVPGESIRINRLHNQGLPIAFRGQVHVGRINAQVSRRRPGQSREHAQTIPAAEKEQRRSGHSDEKKHSGQRERRKAAFGSQGQRAACSRRRNVTPIFLLRRRYRAHRLHCDRERRNRNRAGTSRTRDLAASHFCFGRQALLAMGTIKLHATSGWPPVWGHPSWAARHE
jgi:hypothetical protein